MFKKERKLSGFDSMKRTLNWGYHNILEKKGRFSSMKTLNKEISNEFFQLVENKFL